MLLTVLHKMTVQELAAVVGIQTEQYKWQPAANEFQCSEDVVLTLTGHAHALGPAAGDVGGNQSEQVLTATTDAAMGDQVDLQKADALLVPRRPRTYRNLRLDERARLGRAKAADELEPERL